jgi:hypothetical protein
MPHAAQLVAADAWCGAALRQDDVPLPVLVTAYKDKSFEFVCARADRCIAVCELGAR